MGRIIGLMGQARAGKDTIAEYLAKKHGVVRIGLADPMKRFCKEIFDFSDEQLYGDKRDAFDIRYPRFNKLESGLPVSRKNLTPRYALQTLGTEWGRDCYENVWIDYGIRVAKELLHGYSRYDVKTGLEITEKDTGICPGVAFSDLRFINEFDAVQKAGGLMVRVYRPMLAELGGVSNHASEEQQKGIPDSDFDVIITNDGTLEELYKKIDEMVVPHLESP